MQLFGMEDETGPETEREIAERNFRKLEEHIRKSSLAEGLNDGRDAAFQSSFDAGYEDGFRSSFLLGTYKGMTTAGKSSLIKDEELTEEVSTASQDPLLQKTMRGDCRICVDSNLLHRDVHELTGIHQRHTNALESKLKEQYKTFDSFTKK